MEMSASKNSNLIYWITGSCLLIKLIIQLIGNRNYGFHRDELLHLSAGQHVAWGYMEFPPMIAFLGRISTSLFGDSLSGMRLFPTLAGLIILYLCIAMARTMGGKWRSVLFSGICVLAFLPFYRNHTLFQPVAFDQLWWAFGFYFLIRYVETDHKKDLLAVGIIVGLGLLTKFTMAFWVFGALSGLVFYKKASLYSNRWFYLSGMLALMLFLPNLIWQWNNDFPILSHLAALSSGHLEDQSWIDFVLDQVILVATFIVSLIGLWFSIRNPKYRWIAISTLVVFFTMLFLKAKSYYVYPIYPVLFACGAVQLEKWLIHKKPIWSYILAASILLPFVYFIPDLTPILPIERYIAYKGFSKEEIPSELTSDYSDMFGWAEQVAAVDSLYRSLSQEEQKNGAIWAENYGEAGAIKILGKAYGLPDPISRHGSFWTWGYGNPQASVWISIGNETSSVQRVFEEVTLIKRIAHPYAIEEEQNIPLFICRKPKIDIPAWWAAYEDHVFD